MKRPASLVAAILFWLIALAQLLRVLLRVRGVNVGSRIGATLDQRGGATRSPPST